MRALRHWGRRFSVRAVDADNVLFSADLHVKSQAAPFLMPHIGRPKAGWRLECKNGVREYRDKMYTAGALMCINEQVVYMLRNLGGQLRLRTLRMPNWKSCLKTLPYASGR